MELLGGLVARIVATDQRLHEVVAAHRGRQHGHEVGALRVGLDLRGHLDPVSEHRDLTWPKRLAGDLGSELLDLRVPGAEHLDLRRLERDHGEAGDVLAVRRDRVHLERLHELVSRLRLARLRIGGLWQGELADRTPVIAGDSVLDDLAVRQEATAESTAVVTRNELKEALIEDGDDHHDLVEDFVGDRVENLTRVDLALALDDLRRVRLEDHEHRQLAEAHVLVLEALARVLAVVEDLHRLRHGRRRHRLRLRGRRCGRRRSRGLLRVLGFLLRFIRSRHVHCPSFVRSLIRGSAEALPENYFRESFAIFISKRLKVPVGMIFPSAISSRTSAPSV